MTDYEPLTKTVRNQNGDEDVVCRFAGTNKCQLIHTPSGCTDCPVFKAILRMLNEFETIYIEEK